MWNHGRHKVNIDLLGGSSIIIIIEAQITHACHALECHTTFLHLSLSSASWVAPTSVSLRVSRSFSSTEIQVAVKPPLNFFTFMFYVFCLPLLMYGAYYCGCMSWSVLLLTPQLYKYFISW